MFNFVGFNTVGGITILDNINKLIGTNVGPSVAGLLGAALLIYGIVKIAKGIFSQQQRGSHLAWGGIAFVVGGFLLGGGVYAFFQKNGQNTANQIGLTNSK